MITTPESFFFSELFSSAFLSSSVAVALAEIGDKTQLLTLFLTLKFRNKWAIVLAIILATLVNHGLSAWFGSWLGDGLAIWLSNGWVDGLLSGSFVVMGLWILVPDKDDEDESRFLALGAFVATLILFSLAELGDKTQIATVLLAAEWQQPLPVTLGTTLGMLIANVPVIWFGQALLQRLPMNTVRYVTAIFFIVAGLWVLVR
ncbi:MULTISPECIES: TMEM165/GDT1 family protein [unclassified Oceanobacter]|jgi:putative Ca2+/H+ antiporter (TMEM165/GDT1 family)|uniref:TMEM165/GDT1 family protein n=1 Tax=unclassified Oceanobacter TaxID=2620260 RepID=UPI0026E390C2|nr:MULTISPECIES: TMEM165/GDT1 family protein [unclassified Oceanobacter]MDO6683529.1 TMEM165/GDT1 family protein [Oceanobacter sp. 5_MG-2023]MDP2546206.1 TMEM165/GDT1 family protein [Oceanobacter sp. 4_MG-2023]MDP2607509.1 TMEM165/GDT1 family protein [Oceanobacter sp. 1_MG-2023]MDP2610777.1 TMEM165/GDT1 family protein [Oceanobacter sp. 2_MG-2023]